MSLALLALGSALAWETDQLSARSTPLSDLTDKADAHLQAIIAQAIAATNEATGCQASPQEAHRILAREIHQRVGKPAAVEGRGWLRGRGYNEYGAWVEDQPEASWLHNDAHIYAELTLLRGPVLHIAGVCSTVLLAGQRVGVDKLDHFLGMGHAYWERSDFGRDLDQAVAWGTQTERQFYGMNTSLAFSFADLRANLDGYRFYAGLLGPEGVAAPDTDGCLVATQPFSWARWIDWRYDELLNPPVYTRSAARAVTERLEAQREVVCAIYAREREEIEAWQARAFREPDDSVLGKAPPRTDPYRLDELCSAR